MAWWQNGTLDETVDEQKMLEFHFYMASGEYKMWMSVLRFAADAAALSVYAICAVGACLFLFISCTVWAVYMK